MLTFDDNRTLCVFICSASHKPCGFMYMYLSETGEMWLCNVV